MMHDASYHFFVELCGSEDDIVDVVSRITVSTLNPASKRYRKGTRQCTTMLYAVDSFPLGAICPATFLWNYDASTSASCRRMWIWIHPAAKEEALTALQNAIAMTNGIASPACNASLTPVATLADLSQEILTLEFTGPRTPSFLQAVLEPCEEDLERLAFIRNVLSTRAEAIPPGCVLGFDILDPRIKFPQKLPRSCSGNKHSAESAIDWREDAAVCSIWDADVRRRLRETRPSDHQLNQLRYQVSSAISIC